MTRSDYRKLRSSSSYKVGPSSLSVYPPAWPCAGKARFHQADLAEMLPPDMGCTKEAKDVIVDCCVGKPISHTLFVYDTTT